jgi:hypothetical protein
MPLRIDKAPQVLARAALQSGGIAALAANLGLDQRVLRHYIDGNEPIPHRLFLEVVDMILQRLPAN